MPASLVKARPEKKLHRCGQRKLQPGGQHPVLAEQVAQHRQHQRKREQPAQCHRAKPGPGRLGRGIDGRIGRALVTEGALGGQGDATSLAVIQQLDSVYVSLVQSSVEMQRLRQAMAQGSGSKVKAKLTLVMEDGQLYNQPGQLLFSDVTVDPSSGTVTVRAQFPNPQRSLLPGTYVRVRIEQGVRPGTSTVPQQAVMRTADGSMVMTVDAEGKVLLGALLELVAGKLIYRRSTSNN